MKSTKKLLGMIAILVMIGFAFTACGDDETPFIPQTPSASALPLEMVKINGGTFKMGSPSNEVSRYTDENYRTANNGEVTLSDFYMGKYPVTQAQYKSVMGTNPSSFKGNNLPVEKVSWFDAIIFCNKLSIKEGLSPAYKIEGKTNPAEWGEKPTWSGDENYATWNAAEIVGGSKGYRLPTEAQWEYACRAGTITPFNTGNNITTSQANYNGNYPYSSNPKGIYRETTTPVNTFAPNAWGLYDMHGNVFEWCWDWYAESYDNAGGSNDPAGAVSGSGRVARGGCFYYGGGQALRSAQRDRNSPIIWYDRVGFRLVRP